MECGGKLEPRPHHEGGLVPWCAACRAFRHPVYSTAVIMIVMDAARERVILIQQYGRGKNILVAGYVDQGESAEDACRREVKEELGLTAAEIRYNRSEYLPRTNTLMLNFTVLVEEGDVTPTRRSTPGAGFPEARPGRPSCPAAWRRGFCTNTWTRWNKNGAPGRRFTGKLPPLFGELHGGFA